MLSTPLIEKGANPVVFCRYLATADHVRDTAQGVPEADHRGRDGRPARPTSAAPAWTTWRRRTKTKQVQRLLVATDCLSEGINLQELFDTVVHYDLSWNPTRHQQREGRVDRFGQPAGSSARS